MEAARRVLVVEDDENIREFVGEALTDEGYEVALAQNGAVALEVIQRFEPRLILLDMRMPVMDGWEFARAYRQTTSAQAPIVVLTAARDAAKRAAEIEAASYLAKPFNLQQLMDLVAHFTEKTER